MATSSQSGKSSVVVGVDGSAGSWRAIHAGAWEALQRDARLTLVHGYPNEYQYLLAPPFVAPIWDAKAPAATMLEEIATRVRSYHPDLIVTTLLRPGTGSQALIEASQDAALVVVGARGRGGFGGLSIGSVAAQTVAHATSPVIVVRPLLAEAEIADITAPTETPPHPGPVIVGVDGSTNTDAALEFAFEEATFRRVPLVVVHVWWILPRHNLGPDVPGRYNLAEARDEARRLLAELTAGWSFKYPDVALDLRPVHSMNPSYELIQASAAAGLTVIGSRGRGGFAGLLLGSVGRDLVGHANSPVAVVHPARPQNA